MKINISLADSDEPCETNPILSQARARIIWGEEASSVRSYLISSGIDGELADAKIRQYLKERNAAIRTAGLKKIVVGGLLFVVSGVICLVGVTSSRHLATYAAYKGIATIGAVGCYGFCKLINGIIYLAHPQFERESVSEME